MATLNATALILRRHRFSESSLVASALTREYGRMDFLAKGCLREKSPMFGHLDHYQHESLLIIERPQAGLDLLIEAAYIDEHAGLRFFPPAFAAAGFLAELALAACMPADPQPKLFDILASGIRGLADLGEPAAKARLDQPTGLNWRDKNLLAGKILRLVTMQTLVQFGFVPELARCVVCGRTPPPTGLAISRRQGGVICPSCRPKAGGKGISANALRALRAAVSGSDYDEISLSDKERRELMRFLVDYSQYVVEKPLHSAKTMLQLLKPV